MVEIDYLSIIILFLLFALVNILYRLFPKNNEKLLEKLTKN